MKFSNMLSEKFAEPEFELRPATKMDDGGCFAGGVKV
jgi:hypothetical protein